jgi:hypothetical protein
MKPLRLCLILVIVLFSVIILSCSASLQPAPPTTTAATKPVGPEKPVLYSAQEAFTRINGFARKWSADAMPIHLTSELTSEANGQDGRATIWRAMFASPSRGTIKGFVCSGSRLPNAPALGTTAAGAESPLSGDLRALMFEPFLFKTDSKEAFEVTLKNGGDKVLKTDAKRHINYVLEWDRKNNAPLWYVVYGDSMKDNKDIGVVNATTGAFLRAKK